MLCKKAVECGYKRTKVDTLIGCHFTVREKQ